MSETSDRSSILAALKARRMQATGLIQNVQVLQTTTDDRREPQRITSQGPGTEVKLEAIAAPKTVRAWAWECTLCEQECVPIRTESRCLCGHRMKEHEKVAQTGEITTSSR